MSSEIYVLFDSEVPTAAGWQAALDAAGFVLILEPDVVPATHTGYLPATLRGQETGFEFDLEGAAELMAAYSGVEFGRPWRHAAALRWGGDLVELLAGYMAAAALARAAGGGVFDPQRGSLLTPDQMLTEVQEIEREIGQSDEDQNHEESGTE